MGEKMIALQLAQILQQHPDLDVFISTDPPEHTTPNGWYDITDIVKNDSGMIVIFVQHIPAD